MRSRRRQRIYQVQKPTLSRDSLGEVTRTYADDVRIAGKLITGSGSKGELAEAIQGTASNVIETRYIPGWTIALDWKVIDIEDSKEYTITGLEDVDGLHKTFRIELEEVVL